MAGNEHPATDGQDRLRASTVRRSGSRPSARDEWLRAHEGRLAVTYEHVGVGIVEVDQAGRMLRVNQKVCELMGHEAADLHRPLDL